MRGDVAGEAERADDAAAGIAERQLGGGNPLLSRARQDLVLDDVDQRLPVADDRLLLLEEAAGQLRREEVEVGLPHGLVRIGQAVPAGQGRVDADEAAAEVLEVDRVRERVHQDAQQLLIGHHARRTGHRAAPRCGQGRPSSDRPASPDVNRAA